MTEKEPKTSPRTGPAEDCNQPGDAEALAAWAAGLGLEAGDLDDLVHDAYSRLAALGTTPPGRQCWPDHARQPTRHA
jgi:hypothetical protein